MQTETLLIPIAAFALTLTTAQAFDPGMLQKAGLTQSQIEAFETAHELHKKGQRDAAREALTKVQIDLKTVESIREVVREHKKTAQR